MDVPALPPDLLGGTVSGEASAAVRARVVVARARQASRYTGDRVHTNAELTPALMTAHCALDRAARRVLDASVRRLSLSARGYDRIRKVARTIADLGESDAIDADAVAEALQFRML